MRDFVPVRTVKGVSFARGGPGGGYCLNKTVPGGAGGLTEYYLFDYIIPP